MVPSNSRTTRADAARAGRRPCVRPVVRWRGPAETCHGSDRDRGARCEVWLATPRAHTPEGFRMAKRAIYQRTVDGKWVVIELPANYHEGDRLPVRGSPDERFDSREDAQAEVLRRAADD
jgi:hypothetical protein